MIIDHVDKLELSDDKASVRFNELRSLTYLAHGLWFLFAQIQNVEAEVTKRLPKDKKVSFFGSAPEMEGIPQDLVACAFNWYSVTVCNYAKMIGWLANDGDSTKARDYMEKVLPEVYLWRNKVGAHFAIIDPRKDDNAADLAKSVMFPLSFDVDAFYAGSMTLTLGTSNTTHISRQDMRWSLTHVHGGIVPRYWPTMNG